MVCQVLRERAAFDRRKFRKLLVDLTAAVIRNDFYIFGGGEQRRAMLKKLRELLSREISSGN